MADHAPRLVSRLGLLAATLLVPNLAAADTITVTRSSLVPDSVEIQIAINAAGPGDTVCFPPGNYLMNAEVLIADKADLTLVSLSPEFPATLDGGGVTRHFRITDSSVTIDNLVFQNGQSTGSDHGGSIELVDSDGVTPTSLTLLRCVFEDNTATPSSLGAAFGGAIAFRDTGAINAALLARDTVFRNNSATTNGGAIDLRRASATFDRCVFETNDAGTSSGGAIAHRNADSGGVTVTNSLFDGNQAPLSGSAVFANTAGSHFTIQNCTFVNNQLGIGLGSATVDVTQADLHLTNSVLWGNLNDTTTVANPTPASVVDSNTIQFTVFPGNDTADPLYRDAGAGDYRLSYGSPAIDAGLQPFVTADFDPAEGDLDLLTRVDGLGPDRGAYELPQFAGIAYVDQNATGFGTGVDWPNAFNEARDAVNFASDNPLAGINEIRIAEGVYRPRLTVPSGVDVIGGFPTGGAPAPTLDAASTVISADILGNDASNPDTLSDNASHVIDLDGVSDLTIRNLSANFSTHGAILISDCTNITLDGLIVRQNQPDSNTAGGVDIEDSSDITVRDCRIARNDPRNEQGIFFIVGIGGLSARNVSNILIEDCVFDDNYGIYTGGADFDDGTTATIRRTRFTSNRTVAAPNNDGPGALLVRRGSIVHATNVLIDDNYADNTDGAAVGIRDAGSELHLNHATVVNNENDGGSTSGVINVTPLDATLTIENSILWGNFIDGSGNAQDRQINDPTATVRHTLIQGLNSFAGNGNISGNPMFVNNNNNNDFRLGKASPAIDAGDSTATSAGTLADLDGNPRFVDAVFFDDTGIPDGSGNVTDMGAYEAPFDTVNVCPGDINTTGTTDGIPDCVTNLADLQFFLTAWQNDLGMTPGSIADVNTTGTTNGLPDGMVNLSDLQFFLTQWQLGLALCP